MEKKVKTTKVAKVTKSTKKELSAKDRKKVNGGKLNLEEVDLSSDFYKSTSKVPCINGCCLGLPVAEVWVSECAGTVKCVCPFCGASWPFKKK